MTPDGIADWLDGFVVDEADYDPRIIHKAAATIRELEARVNDRNQRLEDTMIDAESIRQRLVANEANLKISTEALYEIMTEDFTEHQLRRFVSGVLASIKSI